MGISFADILLFYSVVECLQIVQKLVRMLPNGQQVKREVDFILDEIFNTMTPMMFHMREIIFVTYNRVSVLHVYLYKVTFLLTVYSKNIM